MEFAFKSGKMLRIEVENDYGDCNPRHDRDNLGTIITTNNRYFTGDEIIGEDWTERGGDIIIEGGIVLPICAYIHTGVTVWHSEFETRCTDPFDSGVIGFSYVTAKDLAKEYPELTKEERIERGKKILDAELKALDNYLNYGVYCYYLEDSEGNELDSCFGFDFDENPLDLLDSMLCNISNDDLSKEEREEVRTYVKENCNYLLD